MMIAAAEDCMGAVTKAAGKDHVVAAADAVTAGGTHSGGSTIDGCNFALDVDVDVDDDVDVDALAVDIAAAAAAGACTAVAFPAAHYAAAAVAVVFAVFAVYFVVDGSLTLPAVADDDASAGIAAVGFVDVDSPDVDVDVALEVEVEVEVEVALPHVLIVAVSSELAAVFSRRVCHCLAKDSTAQAY
jgi:hypothetical protein